MIQKETFGVQLKELLTIRGWSAAQLAKALNIDASYVRRWIRGNRTPALNSNYVDQIADALCNGLDKEYRKAAVSALKAVLEEKLTLNEEENSMRAGVTRLLRDAQIRTLSLDSESRINRRQAGSQSEVSELLMLSHRDVPPSSAVSVSSVQPESETITFLERIPRVISGRRTILAAAISMLQSALDDGRFARGGEITLTFQSEREIFEGYPELHHEWQHTIVRALSQGWSVRHLCRLNKNVQRSLRLVNQILDWTNYSGAYSLYYFDKYGIDSPPYEIILVSGMGAILGFAADNYKEIDAGLYLDEIDAVSMIERYVGQMFLNIEPLIKILSQEEYFELNPAKDRKSGNHLLSMQDLSFLTVPYPLMEKYLRISIPDEAERRIHLRRIADTIQSFHRDIKHYKMRHIYPIRAFEELVTNGRYYSNFYYRPAGEDVREHLLHVLELLETYEKFEIALVDENKYKLLSKAQFDIKGDHTILIGVMPKRETDHKVELISITEGTIVNAFQQYFDDWWERINPVHRDKAFVVSWIKDKLDSLGPA